MKLERYTTDAGVDVFHEWFSSLRDAKTKVAIGRRIDRLTQGNFGQYRYLRDGVWELKIDWGPGFRVYYALVGNTVVLLLCGGAKDTQNLDIIRAVKFWEDYQKRSQL